MQNHLRGRHLHLECASGLAGDMFLAAALDAGVPEEVVTSIPDALGLRAIVVVSRSRNAGLAGCRVRIVEEQDATDHRGLTEILQRIKKSELAAGVRSRATEMFQRLGEVEAAAHAIDVETVHFHELGAVDSMVDIVGAAAVMAYLAPQKVTCGTIVTGSGTVETAHGTLPVPAPATLALLTGTPSEKGIPFQQASTGELLTPTGALILRTFVGRYGVHSPMVPEAWGMGLGSRVLEDRPNAVRLTLGRPLEGDEGDAPESVLVLEALVDDASGETLAAAVGALLAAGALDAFLTPLIMKKGRPGFLVTALVRSDQGEAMAKTLLRVTGSLGCRIRKSDRLVAERESMVVETPWGKVDVKLGSLDGEVFVVAPESDSCAAVAKRAEVTWKEVYDAAKSAGGRQAMTRREVPVAQSSRGEEEAPVENADAADEVGR